MTNCKNAKELKHQQLSQCLVKSDRMNEFF